MASTTANSTLPNNLETGLWIGGRSIAAASGETFDVINPATEEAIVSVADSTSEDWAKAVDLADEAFAPFAALAPRERADILLDIHAGLQERKEDIARVMTMEMGKPLAESRGEVDYGSSYFQWFAEEAVRSSGRTTESQGGNGYIVTLRKPVGPVLAITPWNFPLAMAARKIAPAFAVGCPVVAKPASETPLTMMMLARIIADVFESHDVPAGAFSLLTTKNSKEFSSELMQDSRIKKVTFTGSTGVGQVLVEQSKDHLPRTSMELGGNSPFVVAADADLEDAIEAAKIAKMRNGGETCVAANRFIVAEEIAEEFTAKLVDMMKEYVAGYGLEEGVTQGPIINKSQLEKITELVDGAVDAGAKLAYAGEVPEGDKGFFYPATVLSNVPRDAEILDTEIFGPVAVVTTFSGIDEAISIANDTEYGLAAYGFTTNFTTAQRFAAELEAGMVGVNRAGISDAAAPFGGIGFSGFGREGGAEGLDEYTYVKYVALP